MVPPMVHPAAPLRGILRLVAPGLLGTALGTGLIALGNPARALVPYVYLPPAREMEAAGFSFIKNINNLPWQHCLVFGK